MHRLIYIDYAYVIMYSITKTIYIMKLRLKKTYCPCIMQKNSREIPVYHAFFNKKKTPGFYRKLSAATIRIIISKYMYRFYFPNNTPSKIK